MDTVHMLLMEIPWMLMEWGRIRLVGVNAPEFGEPGYQKAKDFVKSKCLEKVARFRHR